MEDKMEDKMEAVSPPESPGSIGQWSEEEQAHSFQSMLCQNITGRYSTVQYSTVQYVNASTSAHVTCDCSLSRPRVQPSAAECPGGPSSSEQSDQSLPLRLHQHPRQLRPPALHHGGEAEVGQVLSVLEEGENELSKTVLLLITDNQMFSTNHGKRRR